VANNESNNIVNLPLPDKIDNLASRLSQVEARFSDMGYNFRSMVQSELKTNYRIAPQAETMHSLHTAVCVETIDPWKQGRVRFFSPLLHDFQTPVKALPWAYPVSNQGGFDDSGCTWVPPAGSKLCILFEAGNRSWGYYIGTTWDRDRSKGWDIVIPEYDRLHRGHRGGYLVGEENQVFPPWNTENYNGNDITSILDFEKNEDAQNKITYPNIYGWKTPQKHMIKMVDGNYKCNFRWQRLEIKSAQGNHIILKDDRVHPTAQWAHPDCGCGGGDVSQCNTGDIDAGRDQPIEKLDNCPADADKSSCANPYFKHRNECKPYQGPQNCQNNKVDKVTLPQSGIQFISLSGHTLWMDDSVLEPKGSNEWESSLKSFDYGCPEGEGVFKGKTVWKSAHGHQIMMSDVEPDDKPRLRGDENFIRMLTATGNKIELNDDSSDCSCTCDQCSCGCGSDNAGPKRGITMQSTSRHTIEMIDENNKQCSPNRKEGGNPKNEATDAFVRIRTGYGLEIKMSDDNSQKNCQSQYIQILAPQKGEDDSEGACCGPHIIRLQEDPNCGYIFVRAAGDYICMTEGDHYTVVGVGKSTEEFCDGGCLGPRNWFTAVSKHSLHYSCNFYFNKAEIHAFLADKLILLMAGKDCPPPPDGGEECSPCIGPVAVLIPTEKGPQLKASDRVFASSSTTAPCISLFMLSPFVKCNTEPPAECE
jgi:hypothetical protein